MVKKNEFGDLVSIIAKLRAPGGCPWDREQTHKDINPYMLEEVHEAMEAIDRNDMDSLKEELGDLMLHIVFHAQMADEAGNFNIDDVINGVCEKLVHRHPHVFGDKKVKGAKEVVRRWEQLKKKENKSVLGGVPAELPALLKAFRLGEKAGRIGFDWTDMDGILDKLNEEIKELREAKEANNNAGIEHEYGDLLFTLANIGRFLKVNPEESLRKSTNRFIERFNLMEEEAGRKGLDLHNITLVEWNRLWERAKAKTKVKTKV